jgi:hypothetical protein
MYACEPDLSTMFGDHNLLLLVQNLAPVDLQ